MSELNVIPNLLGFKVSVEHITNSEFNSFKYFVINLDFKKRNLRLYKFKKNQIKEATDHYSKLEKSRSKFNDVVLIRVDSLNELKKSYPNYFADTNQFVALLEKI